MGLLKVHIGDVQIKEKEVNKLVLQELYLTDWDKQLTRKMPECLNVN